jgi:hypothetical protein
LNCDIKLQHVRAGSDELGRPIVLAEDSEVFAFVQDHLVEVHSFDCLRASGTDAQDASALNTMTFEVEMMCTIEAALSVIDEAAIQDVFELNNPGKDE